MVRWLLEGDPAVRWQTLRDLKGAADRTVIREQRRLVSEGWAARLLEFQEGSGLWAGGLYNPKWISTTYTLLLLRWLGLPAGHPQAVRGTQLLMKGGFWKDGGINFWPRRYPASETCITAMVLALNCWNCPDDHRIARIVEHLLEWQMADGGWNCKTPPGYGGATHGSFHTTISALEALLEYERHHPGDAKVAEAQQRGREFLLVHRLYRSHRTGNIVRHDFTRMAFPPQWYYDFLRALDYFRASGASPDPRMSDAIELLHRKRLPEGVWPLEHVHPGRSFFQMEEKRQPSRWNTLRSLRVLRWFEGAQ